MSAEFLLYLRLGFTHIADLAGYDHILFVAALAVAYPPSAWRRLAILVTAFTVGHSVTLALATLDAVRVPSAVVEALIPLTIMITAALTIIEQRRGEPAPAGGVPADGIARPASPAGRFLLAAGFGLIHGLGFSTFLRALLGGEESITLPLLAFNVGLEAGQLLILAVVLLAGAIVTRLFALARRDWVLVLSGATGGIATILFVERLAGS